MPQTLLSRLTAPRGEHPLEAEGLRVLWWMHIAMAGFLAVLFRMWNLGSLPGVNGDEAWYGMVTEALLSGESSAWLTPTGNPLNPFYFLPLLFLHSLFGPSFTILRVPAVVSGLAALAVNVALCRKLFGERTALISTLALAVLPINIAYSRFGWDTSQTLLATLLVLYACAALARCGFDIEKSENLTGRKKRRARFQDPKGRRTKFFLFAATAFGCSLLVHPTNIFLAPMVVVSAIVAWRVELREFFCGPHAKVKIGVALLSGTAAAIAAVVIGSKFAPDAIGRLASFSQLGEFSINFARLFSGVTVCRYIAGSCMPGFDGEPWIFNGSVYDILGIAMVAAGVLMVGWWLWRARPKLELALAAGYLLSLLGFYLVAGPSAIQPHFERYALCLIAPAVLLFSRAAINLFDSRQALGGMLFATATWIFLLGFFANYFWAFEATGGESHRAFRTAEVEPKLAAFELIKFAEQDATAEYPAVIYSSEWWNYRPLGYLAMKTPEVEVRELQFVVDDDTNRKRVLQHLQSADGQAWIVEFAMGDSLPAVQRFLTNNEIPWQAMEQINDYAGRPVLILMKAGRGASFDPIEKPAIDPRMP